jgi:Na+/phosphate symporter
MYLYNIGTAVIIWLIVLGAINSGISNGSIGMIFLGVIIPISAIALEQIRKQKNKGKQKSSCRNI